MVIYCNHSIQLKQNKISSWAIMETVKAAAINTWIYHIHNSAVASPQSNTALQRVKITEPSQREGESYLCMSKYYM